MTLPPAGRNSMMSRKTSLTLATFASSTMLFGMHHQNICGASEPGANTPTAPRYANGRVVASERIVGGTGHRSTGSPRRAWPQPIPPSIHKHVKTKTILLTLALVGLALLGKTVIRLPAAIKPANVIDPPNESEVELTVVEKGTTYKLYRASYYRVNPSSGKWEFVDRAYDPDFYAKNHVERDGDTTLPRPGLHAGQRLSTPVLCFLHE